MAEERVQISLSNDIWKGIHPAIRAVFLLGMPTVAAGYLIYLMSGSMAVDIREIREQMSSHTQTTTTLIEKMNEYRGNQDVKLDILIRIAQTQCVNAATDVTQRRDCLNAGK